MEAIHNYVDALFATLPQDTDTLRIKADMLANLEEKYHALLDEGKNEAEATGLVISSIGSADELRGEFGFAGTSAVPDSPNAAPAQPCLPVLTRQDWGVIGLLYLVWAAAMVAATYIVTGTTFDDRTLTYFGWATFWMLACIAGGVRLGYALCVHYQIPIRFYILVAVIALPVTLCAYCYLGQYWGLWNSVWTYFPAVLLLLAGAAWLEHSKTRPMSTVAPRPDGAPDPAVAQEYGRYETRKHIMIATAVALFILAPFTCSFFEETLHLETPGTSVFFAMLAPAVALCILSGRKDGYYRELYGLGRDDDEDDDVDDDRKHPISSLFASIAFPVAAAIYVCIGLFFDLWHPGWVIFLICTAITAAIAAWEDYRSRA